MIEDDGKNNQKHKTLREMAKEVWAEKHLDGRIVAQCDPSNVIVTVTTPDGETHVLDGWAGNTTTVVSRPRQVN